MCTALMVCVTAVKPPQAFFHNEANQSQQNLVIFLNVSVVWDTNSATLNIFRANQHYISKMTFLCILLLLDIWYSIGQIQVNIRERVGYDLDRNKYICIWVQISYIYRNRYIYGQNQTRDVEFICIHKGCTSTSSQHWCQPMFTLLTDCWWHWPTFICCVPSINIHELLARDIPAINCCSHLLATAFSKDSNSHVG